MNINYEAYIHEIHGILHQIGLLNQINEMNQTDEMKENTQLIQNCIDRSKKLKNDFQKYRQFDLIIKKNLVNVNNIVREIINENAEYAKVLNIDIIPVFGKCRAYTDVILLKECMGIVLTNAIKYSNNNGSVIINTSEEYGHSIISIKDFGIGMTENEIKMLGKPFYRTNRIERDGSGMGIAILFHKAKLLDIKVEILSELNKGTTVNLKIKHIMG